VADSFSADARTYAERVNAHIVLIDGPELAQLMVQHNCGVRVEDTLVLKEVANAILRKQAQGRTLIRMSRWIDFRRHPSAIG
jgi:hypothetical protein